MSLFTESFKIKSSPNLPVQSKMKVSWSCPFDDKSFVQRIEKFRNYRLNKRVKTIKIKKKIIGIIPNRKKSKKNKEDEVVGASNSELKEEPEDKQDKQTHEYQFFNYDGLTTEEATRISNILKPPLPEAEETENETKNETPTETKGKTETEAETQDELGDPEVKEFVKDCIKRRADPKDIILNLPLVVSSLTTVIMRQSDEAVVKKVIAGGHDATEGDMEAVAAGGDTEILGKGGG